MRVPVAACQPEFEKASGSGSRACVKAGEAGMGRKKGGSSCEVMGRPSEILFASWWGKDMSKMIALYCIALGSRSNV